MIHKLDGARRSFDKTREAMIEQLKTENASLKAELAELKSAQEWQPIETAPKEGKAWYWIVPKTAEEAPMDTSGNPIVARFEPHMEILWWGSWSMVSKPLYWLPLPNQPMEVKNDNPLLSD